MSTVTNLIIDGETYAVLAIAPGQYRQITVTLNRTPEIKPQHREHIVLLIDGDHREPYRIAQPPAGPQITLNAVY
jgi:hypothetical protein